jgi:hypothetical protein
MVAFGVKFGFVSTYKETVFLKVDKRNTTGDWSVYYSEIIKYDDMVTQGDTDDNLKSISVRLGVLYIVIAIDCETLHKLVDTILFLPEVLEMVMLSGRAGHKQKITSRISQNIYGSRRYIPRAYLT